MTGTGHRCPEGTIEVNTQNADNNTGVTVDYYLIMDRSSVGRFAPAADSSKAAIGGEDGVRIEVSSISFRFPAAGLP